MSMSCVDMEVIPGCMVEAGQPPVPVAVHYQYGKNATGGVIIVATRYTDAAGAPITLSATQSVIPGACPAVKSDFEMQLLCDDADGNPATPGVPFLRKIERVYDGGTGAMLTETVSDFELDGVTAYAVVGTVNASCVDDYEFEEITVCDAVGAAHIRRQTQVNGQFVTLGFFNPTTGAASTPTGAVGPCPTCGAMTAQGVLTSWGTV